MDKLKTSYLNLKKYSDQLNKDYHKLMRDDFNEEKWVSDGKKIDDNIKKFERTLRETKNLLNLAKNSDNVDDSITTKVEELLNTINKTTEPNMRAMKDKISQFDFDIGMNEEGNENGDDQDEENGQVEMDLMNNQEVIEQRGKQLREIAKVSAIIKDTTDKMSQQLNEQGEILVNVENHIDKANENVEDAHKEIVKADGYSKGNNKRLIIIIVIIIVAVGAALGIILPLALKGKDEKNENNEKK
jgi:hypothetical protein